MVITGITKGKGKKYRVYGEDEYLFSLYAGELKKYHISEGLDIDMMIISSIMDEIIYKRGKERALYLLERRPMTERMMRDKLISDEYPDEMVEKIVAFLYKYHYLDDMEYIHMYVNTYGNRKSIKQMRLDLLRKGVSKEDMNLFFEQNTISEEEGFLRQFEKYTRNKNMTDMKDRQRVFRYFYAKGYAPSLIESAIQNQNT